MARMFDMLAIALDHAAEFGCQPVEAWVPLTSERTCPLLQSADQDVREQCYEQHQHARTCDDCGIDLILTRAECEHSRVSTHRCPDCGFTKRYAGRPA